MNNKTKFLIFAAAILIVGTAQAFARGGHGHGHGRGMSADGFPLLRPLTHIPVSESPMPSIGEPKGIKGNGRIGQTPFAIPALGSPGSNFPGRMP